MHTNSQKSKIKIIFFKTSKYHNLYFILVILKQCLQFLKKFWRKWLLHVEINQNVLLGTFRKWSKKVKNFKGDIKNVSFQQSCLKIHKNGEYRYRWTDWKMVPDQDFRKFGFKIKFSKYSKNGNILFWWFRKSSWNFLRNVTENDFYIPKSTKNYFRSFSKVFGKMSKTSSGEVLKIWTA